MSKMKTVVRIYTFTDAWLIQLADGILVLIVRDGGELTPRGVTAAKKDNLQALRDAFAGTKPDDYYIAIVTIKTEEKDAARSALTKAIRTIFVAAENVFGTDNGHYRSFGDAALSKLSDEEMIRNSRLAISTAGENLAKLADEGITQAILDEAKTLADNFDKAVDSQLTAQRDRDLATEDRIVKGNNLYKAIVKICNTGKDIWYETNESKYNDYVIYNTPTGEPEPTGKGNIRGTVTNPDNEPVEGVVCKVLNTEIVVETDEFGEYEADNVPVGDQAMEFTHPDYETYKDDVVSVFENQETINDIEMVPLEVPAPPEP
ncbi:MAG: carboxypeptidase regulatory-like domain-containing protein [Bacteroidetes bacterium]|nr:carboxypeptidase regulatory-like domain-containing protein [Bacteroidota bacterium]